MENIYNKIQKGDYKILPIRPFTPFYISNADFSRQKKYKMCKINSRNFTYDGLIFSSSFLPEEVKDDI